jgi:hypothetical protein
VKAAAAVAFHGMTQASVRLFPIWIDVHAEQCVARKSLACTLRL